MKILHCIPNMAGGGAERQLTYLVKGQVELGLDVHVVLCSGGPNLMRLRETGANIHFLKKFGNHDPVILVRLIKLVRRLCPDLVQTWMLQMDVLGGLASMVVGVPFIVSERSSAALYNGTFKWRLRELVVRKSAAVIANSLGGKEYWTSVLSNKHTCFVVPNAIPLEEIEAASPHEVDCSGFEKGVPRILFVGRLSAGKQVGLLMDAFSSVYERTNSILIICGKGEEEANLRARVERDKGLRGRVVFLLYQENVWGLMKACQLYVSLSMFEGCPNAVIEAMVCGLPLVLSDVPQHREIAGNNAWYVSENPAEIADKIVQALQYDTKKCLVEKSSLDAWRLFSPHQIALQINECYESILTSFVKLHK